MADNSKISALRAATPPAPQGPSGPQALAYDWMSRRGPDLVMPDRSPVDQQAWRNSRNAKSRPPPAAIAPPGTLPIASGRRVPPINGINPRMPAEVRRESFGIEPAEDIVPIRDGIVPNYQMFDMPAGVGPQPAFVNPESSPIEPTFNFESLDFAAVQPESVEITPAADVGSVDFAAVQPESAPIEPTFDFSPADLGLLDSVAPTQMPAVPQQQAFDLTMIDPLTLEMLQDEYAQPPIRARALIA